MVESGGARARIEAVWLNNHRLFGFLEDGSRFSVNLRSRPRRPARGTLWFLGSSPSASPRPVALPHSPQRRDDRLGACPPPERVNEDLEVAGHWEDAAGALFGPVKNATMGAAGVPRRGGRPNGL